LCTLEQCRLAHNQLLPKKESLGRPSAKSDPVSERLINYEGNMMKDIELDRFICTLEITDHHEGP
jgi:hypothetical protein